MQSMEAEMAGVGWDARGSYGAVMTGQKPAVSRPKPRKCPRNAPEPASTLHNRPTSLPEALKPAKVVSTAFELLERMAFGLHHPEPKIEPVPRTEIQRQVVHNCTDLVNIIENQSSLQCHLKTSSIEAHIARGIQPRGPPPHAKHRILPYAQHLDVKSPSRNVTHAPANQNCPFWQLLNALAARSNALLRPLTTSMSSPTA